MQARSHIPILLDSNPPERISLYLRVIAKCKYFLEDILFHKMEGLCFYVGYIINYPLQVWQILPLCSLHNSSGPALVALLGEPAWQLHRSITSTLLCRERVSVLPLFTAPVLVSVPDENILSSFAHGSSLPIPSASN